MDSLFEFLEKSVNANYFTGFGLATTLILAFRTITICGIYSASKGNFITGIRNPYSIGFKSVCLEETVNYSRMIFK